MRLQAPTVAERMSAATRESAAPDLCHHVHDAARRARVGARVLGALTTETKNRALDAAADALLTQMHAIIAANAEDLDTARAAGIKDAMLDRLALNPQRVDGIA